MSISINNLTINSNVENNSSSASTSEDSMGSGAMSEADVARLRKELFDECKRLIRYELERAKER